MEISPFLSISHPNFLVATEVHCWEGNHMILHILWSKCEVKIFTNVSKITCGYRNTLFFASVIQNSNLLTWCESMMTNTKFPISSTRNYSSNYIAHGASQFSITSEYQKIEFWKCNFSSFINTNRSPLKQSITELALNISFLLIPLLIQSELLVFVHYNPTKVL